MLVTVANMRDVEVLPHGLIGRCFVLPSDGSAAVEAQVVGGSVTVYEMGVLPNRTCTVTVMAETVDFVDIREVLNTTGAWIRLYHDVDVPGSAVAPVRVPLGVFRVAGLVHNWLQGTIVITGEDAGALVRDYDLATLALGRVPRTKTFHSALYDMLRDTLYDRALSVPFILKWWSSGSFMPVPSVATLPKMALQYEGSRVDAVTALAKAIGRVVKVRIDGVAVWDLIVPRTTDDPDDFVVRPGESGNLEDYSTAEDRDGIYNVGLMTYSQEVVIGSGKTETRQRRLVTMYGGTDSDVSVVSPFGRVTAQLQSTGVTTDAEAIAASQTQLKTMIGTADDVNVDTSPIYGLEAGDVCTLWRDRAQTKSVAGVLIGATIPLTVGDGGWTLTVRPATRRRISAPKWQYALDRSPTQEPGWTKLTSNPKVDMTMRTRTGWGGTNMAITDGGSMMVAKSTTAGGPGVSTNVSCTQSFTAPPNALALRRVQISFEIKAYQDMWARAYGRPATGATSYGEWVFVAKGQTGNIVADVKLSTSGTFSIGVQSSRAVFGAPPDINGLPTGARIDVIQASVFYAVREVIA